MKLLDWAHCAATGLDGLRAQGMLTRMRLACTYCAQRKRKFWLIDRMPAPISLRCLSLAAHSSVAAGLVRPSPYSPPQAAAP